MILLLYRQIIQGSFWKITRRKCVKKAWYNLGYLIISNYSRWRIRQREVEQRNCAIHRDISDRRSRGTAPRICRSLSQRSTTIHDGRFTEVFKDSRVRAWLCTESRGGPTWQFSFSCFFFARGSFALDAFASVRLFVGYAAYLRGSCGLYDPRTNERPIDQSILFRRSAK